MKVSCVSLKVCFELSKAKGKHFLCTEKQIDALLNLTGAKEHIRQLNGEMLIFEIDPKNYSSEWVSDTQYIILKVLRESL